MTTKTIFGPRDGVTFNQERDGVRLNRQASLVFDVMCDGLWRSLDEISELTGQPPASVSARLRDLRKPRFGGFTVQRKYHCNGVWLYRLVVRKSEDAA